MRFHAIKSGPLRTGWSAQLVSILAGVCGVIVGVWFLLSLLSRFPGDRDLPVVAAGIVIDEAGSPVAARLRDASAARSGSDY